MGHIQRISFFVGLMMVGQAEIAAPAQASDCNNNGIDDTVELATCPAMDLVFLVDTSFSEEGSLVPFCNAIRDPNSEDDVEGILTQAGLTFNMEILRIGALGIPCPCCADDVPNVYGTTAPGLPEVLGDCDGNGLEGAREDWATATAIVAANKTWTLGSRIIVFVQ